MLFLRPFLLVLFDALCNEILDFLCEYGSSPFGRIQALSRHDAAIHILVYCLSMDTELSGDSSLANAFSVQLPYLCVYIHCDYHLFRLHNFNSILAISIIQAF